MLISCTHCAVYYTLTYLSKKFIQLANHMRWGCLQKEEEKKIQIIIKINWPCSNKRAFKSGLPTQETNGIFIKFL